MSQAHTIRAIYIWLGGKNTHHDIRSKERTLTITHDADSVSPETLLNEGVFQRWNYDGSSTDQAKGKDTEILLVPVRALRFVPQKSTERWYVPRFLVLCECYTPNGQPTPDNTRHAAKLVFESAAVVDTHPWFGMEQEFVLMEGGRPLNWPAKGGPAPQGPYYCSTGPSAWGRSIVDDFYDWALKIGLKISGTNAEVMPAQWEFQVGPCEGLEAGDHVVLARWLLLRVLEGYGPQFDVSFDARPVEGDWNGSGMHTNFSTAAMRDVGHGYANIQAAIANLEKTHKDDVLFYGTDNAKRLSGKHETSSYKTFTWGVGTRSTSVRVPNSVKGDGYGYLEDRRPSGSSDPYIVSARLAAAAAGIASPSLEPFRGTLV